MKIEFEHGDKVLFVTAWDGVHEDTKVYEYGYVEAVIGDSVSLGDGRIVPMDSILPCLEAARNLIDKVKSAFTSGKDTYIIKQYIESQKTSQRKQSQKSITPAYRGGSLQKALID